MSYPEYPNNRLIVNGVDLSTEFGLILTDDYVLGPPAIKTYTLDIPGGNGKLDLTESLLGDTAYDNRTQTFVFKAIDTKDFEKLKTRVSNFLHGKAYDYTITMDPDYTYHGRFKVTEYSHSVYAQGGKVGDIKIEIDADPFKYKQVQVYTVTGLGGNIYYFESGKKRVRPTIETDGPIKIIYNGKLIHVTEGNWTINDLLFTLGSNELYVNTRDVHSMTWGDLITNNVTWGEFGQKRLFEWYKSNGAINVTQKNWGDITGETWQSLSNTTWADHAYEIQNDDGPIATVYIKYDWGDL